MRQNKLLFLIAILLVNLTMTVYAQYTVKTRMGEIYTTTEGWAIGGLEPNTNHADIFDSNGNLIPPSQNYIYKWEQQLCDGMEWIVKLSGFYPTTACDGSWPPDEGPCDIYNTSQYRFRVRVTIGGFDYLSEPVRFPDQGTGTLEQRVINISQKKQDNSAFGMVGKKTGNVFFNYSVPFTITYPSPSSNPNPTDTYKASQSIFSNQKYNRWLGSSDVVNHRNFTFTSPTQNLTSQFNPIGNATVQTNFTEFPSLQNQSKFADPWLIDDFSDLLGPKNVGISALPKLLASGNNNLGINTNHQGVLLNQPIVSGQPYYSISIPSSIYLPQTGKTHNLYLQNWTVSGATLQYPNSLNTGIVIYK